MIEGMNDTLEDWKSAILDEAKSMTKKKTYGNLLGNINKIKENHTRSAYLPDTIVYSLCEDLEHEIYAKMKKEAYK